MKIITLIGADASGKDTQIAHLKNYFESNQKNVQVITIWDSLIDFAEIKDKRILQETIETFLLKFEPHARSFFLMSCLKNSLEKMDRNKDIVLLNGFYHKYWASELTYGVESELWQKNANVFGDSHQIFYLKTPTQTCLLRKNHWSKYEQGAGMALAGKTFTKESFQESLHQNLDRIAETIRGLITIDGSKDEQIVMNEILGYL